MKEKQDRQAVSPSNNCVEGDDKDEKKNYIPKYEFILILKQ